MSDANDHPGAIITMDDMAVVFSVTDAHAVHREQVSVELTRQDPGAVSVTDRGVVEITLPATRSAADFAPDITSELTARGYPYNPGQIVANEGNGNADDGNADDDDDDDNWLS